MAVGTTGGGAGIETLLLNDSAGADKVIAKKGLKPGGVAPDIEIPHMLKRLIIRERTLNLSWRYAYKSGDISLNKYMPVGPGDVAQWLDANEVPPVIYVRGDVAAQTPDIQIEVVP